MSRLFLALLTAALACAVEPPSLKDSLHFGVIGDSGTGDRYATEVAAQLTKARGIFPFDFVVMMGDNIYGRDRPKDYEKKFERPYKALLDAGVKFYASLGNHDKPTQVNYKLFNMNGSRYYTFSPRADVRFFVLDSNYMDPAQVEWLENALKSSENPWKICFFHHPLYSSARRHGPAEEIRKVLEPLFVKYGVSLVLSGHEHVYERIKPQQEIAYFTIGNAAKLRRGNISTSDITAKGFDQDRGFALMELAGDELRFQTISRTGETVDSGSVKRVVRAKAATAGAR